jgi:hypothetical protein
MGSPVAADDRLATLLEVVKAAAPPDARAWVERAWFVAGTPFSRPDFAAAYAGAARRFRTALAPLPQSALTKLRASDLAVPEVWSAADVTRLLLLLHALRALPEADGIPLATDLFRRGDSAERVALLRALPLLPEPARFTELAIEACRSHVLDVFAAIALDNPFPTAHFPELNFNQLAIKTLFMELPLGRVLGWQERANAELRRIAADYAAERRAAGRPVPTDIDLILSTENPA